MMHGWGWAGFRPYGYGYGLIGSFISFIFLIIFLVVVYFIVKKIFFNGNFDIKNMSQSKRSGEYEILKILNEKLVKGEISEEEYIRKKELILKNLK
ncbi:putative membrane protein [Marinitoga hydrogenitolerans DSM 16785]|uniref:Membrane protein n=1 Tax=Marinitoga hydrogenitolerans (strain DSM 16785 / JCM 12826 / AT1271) TaxID=1122195 RepID=A0A1M4YHZ9_MARH1|nr:SHOCT domain-containing protein [Marinitoga hydrogenitolerans]SHF05311.1 putative membrane protein [Marinitoga hydrogenitolerans DSM 16785]